MTMTKRKPPPRPVSPATDPAPTNTDSAVASSLKKQKVDDDFVDEPGERSAKAKAPPSDKPSPKRTRKSKRKVQDIAANEPGEAEFEPVNPSGGGGQQNSRSLRTRTARKPAAKQSSPANESATVKTESEAGSSVNLKADDSSDFVDEPAQKASASRKPSSKGKRKSKGKRGQAQQDDDAAEELDDDVAEEPDAIQLGEDFEDAFVDEEPPVNPSDEQKLPVLPQRKEKLNLSEVKAAEEEADCSLEDPIPEDEARRLWPYRFSIEPKSENAAGSSSSTGDGDDLIKAKCHYKRATVDRCTYNLNDHAHVQAEEGKDSYICKITELFEGVDSVRYFRAQWYYRPVDTVISGRFEELVNEDGKRIFFSQMQDDNNLYCLVKPIQIVRLPLNVDITQKENIIKDFDYYFDRVYLLPHCTFKNLGPDDSEAAASSSGPSKPNDRESNEMLMLDLYSGCGGMSTGLSMGSNINGAKLITKWSLDFNKHACESLELNHPETQVTNAAADNFLILLKQWNQICASYGLVEGLPHPHIHPSNDVVGDDDDDDELEEAEDVEDSEVYEVEEIIGIRYGSPNSKETDPELEFKIKWKGYGSDEDSWEPTECIRGCPAKLDDFVRKSFEEKLLPLPGTVDVICGGPPCQGISGFNRFRDSENPLKDEKNRQIIVFMDIVEFLKPRFVLMENVVDLFKFAGAHLGRYAFARLVKMQYQARLGFMAAGAYGLAQYRMRAFVWGALSTEKLPAFPLPTHDVVVRGNVPKEFEECFVAYDEGKKPEKLEGKLFLRDVIDDLPAITNDEARDVMAYARPAQSSFQKRIRMRKDEMPGFLNTSSRPIQHDLFDHRPLHLNEDDNARVCMIPKEKGACFRDLPGLIVVDNKVRIDTSVARVYLRSGKPLVPEYALSFVRGTSKKPFGRLWWDETVSTVVTRAEPHNQAILHPDQDRVLSIRENARLQGFPDFYQLCGPVKQRYMQIGNAVAIPVARALGYSLALAARRQSSEDALFVLPDGF